MLCAVVVLSVPVASASAAPNNNNSAKLTSAVTVEGIREHLTAFQSIANANGGNRFAGLPGHDASAQYVYDRARAAGYSVRFQEFTYTAQEDLSRPGEDSARAGQAVRPLPGLPRCNDVGDR